MQKHLIGLAELRQEKKYLGPLEQLEAFFSIYTKAKSNQKICLVGALATDFHTIEENVQAHLKVLAEQVLNWVTEILVLGQKQGVFHFTVEPRTKAMLIISNMLAIVQLIRLTQIEDFERVKAAIIFLNSPIHNKMNRVVITGLGAVTPLGMQLALEEAGIEAHEIDYINAHATSNPTGDLSELKAIETVFGAHPHASISATKSMTGHLLGAAGAIEAIACIKAIQEGLIPPTINSKDIEPEFVDKFDFTLGVAKAKTVKYALSNTFGFGGHIACSVFKQFNI